MNYIILLVDFRPLHTAINTTSNGRDVCLYVCSLGFNSRLLVTIILLYSVDALWIAL